MLASMQFSNNSKNTCFRKLKMCSPNIDENLNSNLIREKLRNRYKIVDFVSQNDVYNN